MGEAAGSGRTGRTGRPLGFDREATLAQAMVLFWRGGYAGVSIPEVSAATGLSTSSIYNSFGSKHDLFVAALDTYLAFARDHLLDPMREGSQGLADVEAFLGRLGAVFESPDWPRGCLMVKTIAEFGSSDPEVATRTERFRGDLRDALTSAFTTAATLGQCAHQSVRTRAESLLGLVLAINLIAAADTPPQELTAMFDAARSLLTFEPA